MILAKQAATHQRLNFCCGCKEKFSFTTGSLDLPLHLDATVGREVPIPLTLFLSRHHQPVTAFETNLGSKPLQLHRYDRSCCNTQINCTTIFSNIFNRRNHFQLQMRLARFKKRRKVTITLSTTNELQTDVGLFRQLKQRNLTGHQFNRGAHRIDQKVSFPSQSK